MTDKETRKPPLLELAIDSSGKQVHISEVKNGDACNCRCMYCGEPLTAKQGNGGKAPHFAHKPDSTCRWKEYVRQTDIHWRAERIFLQEKEISLPQIIRTFGNRQFEMFSGGSFPIISVQLEKRISDFIPDIVLQLDSVTLLVEIFVTHAVDDAKKGKIRNDGRYDVIEIDLSDKVHDDITDEELRSLIKAQSRMKWIYSTLEEFYNHNLTSVTKFYQLTDDTNMVNGCPISMLSRTPRSISNCNYCRFFLGRSSEKVSCFYNARHVINRQQLPPLPQNWNVQKQYEEFPPSHSTGSSLSAQPRSHSARSGQRPYYDTSRMSKSTYRKLVNSGKIRL